MTDTFNSAGQAASTGVTHSEDNTNENNNVDFGSLQSQITGMEKRMSDKDSFIGQLQDENQSYREQLAELSERVTNLSKIEEALAGRTEEASASSQGTALDEDTLRNQVLGILEKTKAEEIAESNFTQVASAVTQAFGSEKADEKMRAIAEENGLDFEDLLVLSRKSPQAVLKMAGLKPQTKTGSPLPTKGSHIGYNETPKSREAMLADWAKLRREDPVTWAKPETQKAFRESFGYGKN